MKKLVLFALIAFISFSSYKIYKKDNLVTQTTILENIAHAHGFQNWKNTNELQFTFNVDKDTSHFERTWIWKPKTNNITAINSKDTISYNWATMDSIAHKINGGFINDKFWLLVPFNLIWDKNNFKHTHTLKAETPISKKQMQKLTIVYGNEGGYTPGDAYDLYFEDDYILKEWVFRKSNQEKPSMITTWEDYTEKNGLKIATMHKKPKGDFKLYFTGIQIN